MKLVIEASTMADMTKQLRAILAELDAGMPLLDDHIHDDVMLDDLRFTMRTSGCLRRMCLQTIADLRRISEFELLKQPNFGKKGIFEIREVLVKYNVVLRIK